MPSNLSEHRLWPIQGAAQVAGVSADLLFAGILNGDIPVDLVVLGPARRRFVRGAQMVAWLEGTVAPPPQAQAAIDSCADLLS